MGEKSVRRIVYDTCDAIWNRLSPTEIPPPSQERWQEIEKQFRTIWNFPNCIGAIDGKHVLINKPHHRGSLYYNYKGTCSIVLLAVTNAHSKFTMIDVGAYGKNSDESIFANCSFSKTFQNDTLHFPANKPLPGCDESMPHVIVGDEAFPLKKNLMRPYPGSQLANQEDKKIFNYRLSRARNTSENAFGILSKRFRVYQRRFEIKPEYVNKVVLAVCTIFLNQTVQLYWQIFSKINVLIPEVIIIIVHAGTHFELRTRMIHSGACAL
ncbi:uncharacterized protein [Onthophagus taurus]|uniref:uncharacterized protein n=1 Tax=Onthophagus taurus TaxID=166361 RepID=UPI0039BE9C70